MFSPRLLLLIVLIVFSLSAHPSAQSSNLKLADSKGDPNPVVNERDMIALSVTDASGQPVNGVSFESGSPDIASVDPQTGAVRGVKKGFATVTARSGNESVSVFVAVAKVESITGAKVPGDTKPDTGGRIYLSDPLGNVILRKKDFFSRADVYAGKTGQTGRTDGTLNNALFAGPTAVALDNGPRGGVYIADTLNHSIRKIDFNDTVMTAIGNGSPGINMNDVTPFSEARFNGPRGTAVDVGGNLFISDTDNHAIFIADFAKHEVRMFAGKPGVHDKTDGSGTNARFFRPTAIAVSNDGKTIAVADTGNNRVRLITRDGVVTTLSSSAKKSVIAPGRAIIAQADDEIAFNNPQSVSFDNTDNIYVVDNSGVRIATKLSDDSRQVVSLAQADSFKKASSVVVQGNSVIVLDSNSGSDDNAIKVVTFGAPEIGSLSIDSDKLEGGSELIITGKNFAPESRVLLGDKTVDKAMVETATRIRLKVPPQDAPGTRTLSIQTRGGVAQTAFGIRAKTLSELNDGEITTIAGGVPFLGDGGNASNASFSGPASVAIDGAGNIFISDFSNNRVRRIDTTGVVTTVAGNGRKGFSGDGGPAINASLDSPDGLALNAEGDLFIVDRANLRVRRVDSKTGIITTVVGNGDGGLSGDGGPAAMAGITPFDIAIDSSGNMFITDESHNRIRRVDAASGIITTVAGSGPEFEGGFSGDGGPAINARLNEPFGIAIDADGNIFVSDGANNRIRRIDAKTGIIATYAGTGFKGDFGQGGFDGDGGPANKAKISIPVGLAVDASGNLFFADIFNLRIRKIDAMGIITTVAGNGLFDFGGDDGPATEASLINPEDVLADGSGNIFIADFGNDRVRRVDAVTSKISTLAGIGADTFRGDGGPAINAGLRFPRTMGLDKSDNLYIADQLNNRIRRVDKLTGIITTVAGGGTEFIGDGGDALKATFSNPVAVAVDDAGNLFIADRDRNAIRRVDAATKIITTFAGNFNKEGFSGDGGPAAKAVLDSPSAVAFDPAGNLLIVDSDNHRVRRVDRSSGVIKTIAGSGPVGGFNGSGGFAGDNKKATKARLNIPTDIAVDPAGNIFIADLLNFRIRKIDARKGKITTVAGGGSNFDEGIPATQSELAFFSDGRVAADSESNFFISDQGNHRIRRVDAKTGIITTVIGNGALGYSGDGGKASNASLALPYGLAFDSAGNLYISDAENNVVRVVKGIAKRN